MNAVTTLGQPNVAAITSFLLFIAVSLFITYWAARRTRSTEDFFVAGRGITAGKNGLAMAGDFLSAAGFLGVGGLVSLVGFDGLIYAFGGAVLSWPVMMFLYAEPLRNLGKYTTVDVLSYCLRSSSVRVVSAIVTLALVLMYMLLQMVGAGNLIHLLFGLSYETGVMIVGVIMTVYVLFGGMLATTWVQIIKAALMIIFAAILTWLVLAHFGYDLLDVSRGAAQRSGPAVLAAGNMLSSPVEAISLGVALIFGAASLPHVLMRFYTVPDALTARRSVGHAISVIAGLSLMLFVLGFGAMAIVGPDVIRSVDRGGNMALPLLAEQLGGTVFLGVFAAVCFAIILAVISGLLVAGAATLSHDLWVNSIRGGRAMDKEELAVARIATVVLCIIAIGLGWIFKGQNLAFLVGLSTAVAASANFPVLVLVLYWRRLTAAGAVAGMATGLIVSLAMIYMSPLVQVDILHNAAPIIALRNPGIICIPLAFIVAIVVSLVTQRRDQIEHYAMIEREMLVGRANR
jgi:cation/acetate symporter